MAKIKSYVQESSHLLLSFIALFILVIGVLAGVVITKDTRETLDSRSLAQTPQPCPPDLNSFEKCREVYEGCLIEMQCSVDTIYGNSDDKWCYIGRQSNCTSGGGSCPSGYGLTYTGGTSCVATCSPPKRWVGCMDEECACGHTAKGVPMFRCENYTCVPIATQTPTSIPTRTPTRPPTIPTRTPTPASGCVNCQYQTDVFWGPLIKSFKGSVRYTDLRRIASRNRFPPSWTVLPPCNLKPVSQYPPPIIPALPTACANPIAKGYLKASMNTQRNSAPYGSVRAYLTNYSTSCTYQVGMATYKANGNNIEIQELFDYKLATIGPKQTITLYNKVPMLVNNTACYSSYP